MRAYDVIRRKRDREELSPAEISFVINGLLSGEIEDYQATAFLMAVFLNGMTDNETSALTSAMVESGERIDLSGVQGIRVGKHSTGGVGDKTSVILAPLLASMGVRVPMLSGRGLGYTGGTLDKLASIPGMRTDLSADEFARVLGSVGTCITGQTADVAPADRLLYALRDVTATVESIPLIASSIMSKKVAEGSNGLVLDVKTGDGAFMRDLASARKLASSIVSIGKSTGVRTVAVITDMDQPLGRTVGNALEIKECISALRGRWAEDLKEVTLTLGAWMLNLMDSLSEETEMKKMNSFTLKKYKEECMDFMYRGDAFKKFLEMVDAQGGDVESVLRPNALPVAANVKEFRAEGDGHIRALRAGAVGRAALLLGAGRDRREDDVDPAAGIVLNKKVGDPVVKGEPLAIFHYNDGAGLEEAEEAFRSAVEYGDREPAKKPLVYEAIMS